MMEKIHSFPLSFFLSFSLKSLYPEGEFERIEIN